LDVTDAFVRILFIDFSSAFNTIQPHLMALKLLALNVNPKLIRWIVSFLVNRTQEVRFNNAISDVKATSTGAPQGTVLSPILFTLYTNDCTGPEHTPFIKYSDDTALLDLSNSDVVYNEQVSYFTQWCKDNFLNLNVKKTKEMVIDFRKKSLKTPDLLIDDAKVERVHEYKYLGTTLDDKLSFDTNTHIINKKCQTRLYFLQKLRSLHVNNSILCSFYRCFIEPVLTFGCMCWFGGLTVKNKNILEKNVKICSKVTGSALSQINTIYENRVYNKAKSISQDSSHTLAKDFELLPSGRRYRVPKLKKVKTKRSFTPKAIELLNKNSF